MKLIPVAATAVAANIAEAGGAISNPLILLLIENKLSCQKSVETTTKKIMHELKQKKHTYKHQNPYYTKFSGLVKLFYRSVQVI